MFNILLSSYIRFSNSSVPDFSGVINTITIWVNAAIGILVILQVLFAVGKSIWIYYSVVRHSDEPDTRAIYLGALKWPVIAIVGTLATIALANVIIQIVKASVLSINT